MEKSENICRMCLNVASEQFSPLEPLMQKLNSFLRDVILTPIDKSIICNKCNDIVEESFKFQRTCSSSNKLLKFLKNYSGITHEVDIKILMKGKKTEEKWPKYDHVCRICLKSNEGSYVSIRQAKDDVFGLVLTSCLSVLDENITSNPLICKLCIEILHKMCKFISQVTDIEKKVKSYIEEFGNENIDLAKVMEYRNTENANEGKTEGNAELKLTQENTNLTVTDEKENVGDTENVSQIEENKHSEVSRKRLPSEHMDEESSKRQKIDTDIICEKNPIQVEAEQLADRLPYFNFSKKALESPFEYRTIYIEDWFQQVEEIKTRLNWSDTTSKHKVLQRVKRIPALSGWLYALADLMSWEEWKKKVISAFPGKNDYYSRLLRVARRTKDANETYVDYFNVMLPLLESLNVSPEETVSCILGGIPDIFVAMIGRAGKYKTPGELLTYLKDCDAEIAMRKKPLKPVCSSCKLLGHSANFCWTSQYLTSKSLETQNSVDSTTSTLELIVLLERNAEIDRQALCGVKCVCCDQQGHLSVNCPLIKASQTFDPDIIVIDDEPSKNDENRNKKCSLCDKTGHSALVCPQIKSDKDKSSVTVDNRSKNAVKSSERTHVEKDKSVSKQKTNNQKSVRCSCCDKIGHTSLDCPLLHSKNTKNALDHRICNKCHQEGHIRRNCPSSIKKKENEDTSDVKCNYCNKKGHTRVNCYKFKKQQNENASQQCGKCNALGHLNANCPNTVGLNSNTQNVDNSTNNKQKQKKCYRCNEAGHMRANCPLSKKNSVPTNTKAVIKEVLPKKCLCCNVSGHSSAVCPFLKINKSNANMSKVAKDETNKDKISTAHTLSKCSWCNSSTHSNADCPRHVTSKNFVKKSVNEKPNLLEVPLDKFFSLSNKSGQPSVDNLTTGKSNTESITVNKSITQMSEKCASCNNVGHSSGNCPFSGIKNTSNNKPSISKKKIEPIKFSIKKPTNQTPVKCTRCNTFGHSVADCSVKGGKTSGAITISAQTPQVNYWYQNLSVNAAANTLNTQASQSNSQTSQMNCWDQNSSVTSGANTITTQKSQTNYWNQKTPTSFPNESNVICTCCFKVGHSSKHCVLLSTYLNKQLINAGSTQNSGDSNLQSFLYCLHCKKLGHSSASCPFSGSASDKIGSADNILQNMGQSSRSKRQCLCCNEFGHSSLDCPVLAKYELDGGRKCSCCGKNDHLTENCPFVDLTDQNVGSSQSRSDDRKCSYCGEIGSCKQNCFRFNRGHSDLSEISYTDPSELPSMQMCEYCQSTSHTLSFCPHYPKWQSDKKEQETRQSFSATLHQRDHESDRAKDSRARRRRWD